MSTCASGSPENLGVLFRVSLLFHKASKLTAPSSTVPSCGIPELGNFSVFHDISVAVGPNRQSPVTSCSVSVPAFCWEDQATPCIVSSCSNCPAAPWRLFSDSLLTDLTSWTGLRLGSVFKFWLLNDSFNLYLYYCFSLVSHICILHTQPLRFIWLLTSSEYFKLLSKLDENTWKNELRHDVCHKSKAWDTRNKPPVVTITAFVSYHILSCHLWLWEWTFSLNCFAVYCQITYWALHFFSTLNYRYKFHSCLLYSQGRAFTVYLRIDKYSSTFTGWFHSHCSIFTKNMFYVVMYN